MTKLVNLNHSIETRNNLFEMASKAIIRHPNERLAAQAARKLPEERSGRHHDEFVQDIFGGDFMCTGQVTSHIRVSVEKTLLGDP